MEWQVLLTDGYGRIAEILERTLKDLNEDDLNQQPKPDCNSIGWLAWHLTRSQDRQIADLMGEEQPWIIDGWHTRFNREANPQDTGNRHTPEEVTAFRSPDVETLLGYHRAVLERTNSYIASLSDADLDRELNEPRFQPLPTVGVRLISIMSDNLQHAGQASYLRGILQGRGWSGR
ncbi:DinB family protein [Chloroflexota bacterium]